jgi:hypothetical protein
MVQLDEIGRRSAEVAGRSRVLRHQGAVLRDHSALLRAEFARLRTEVADHLAACERMRGARLGDELELGVTALFPEKPMPMKAADKEEVRASRDPDLGTPQK